MNYMLERFKERSTWIGITGIATALGFQFTDLELDHFITMAVAISGFISTVWPDKANN